MRPQPLHAAAGALATFWTSTLISEVFLSTDAVIGVKHAIALYGLIPMTLFMILAGVTGQRLNQETQRRGRLIDEKGRRMVILRRNGLGLMVPLALFLNWKAGTRDFDAVFYAAQGAELLVGLLQLTMLGQNFRDGLRLAGRLHKGGRAV